MSNTPGMSSMDEFLLGLRNRASRLVVPAEPTETATVVHDRYDTATWDEVKEYPHIASFIDRMRVEHDYVEDLMQDTFNLLIKGAPRVRTAEDMALTHRPHQPVMAALQENAGTKQLRTMTPNSPYTSAMGLVSLTEKLAETFGQLKDAKERSKEAEQKREQSAEAMQQAIEALARAEHGDPIDQPDLAGVAEEMISAAEQAQQDAERAQQEADDAADSAAFLAQGGLQEAAEAAAEQRRDEENLMRGFGATDAQLKRMSFQERLDLAKRLSKAKLAKFTDLLGQFRQVQSAMSRRRIKDVPDEISNVILGDDLQRLLPQELLALAAPETEDDFWLRYLNGELLQFELTGTERMGQGPIIVVCDESGSMEGPPEAWSKALSLALLGQAKQRGRDFHYIGFADYDYDYNTRRTIPQVHTLSFPGGEGSLTQVLEMTEHFYGGGTEYIRPLREAMKLVQQYHEAGKEKPDIVFITDEEHGRLPTDFVEEWNALKRTTSMRCFGIAMCPRVNGALSVVSDNTRTIADLTAHEVSDLFQLI